MSRLDHDIDSKGEMLDRVWRLSAVVTLAKRIHSTLDIDAVLQSFLDVARSELGVPGGAIYLVDSTSGLLVPRCRQGQEGTLLADGGRGQLEAEEAMKSAETAVVSRAAPPLEGADAGADHTTLLSYPLQDTDARSLGVLQLFADANADFDQDQLRFLGEMAHFLSLAVKNAQFHADSLSKARLDQELAVAQKIQAKTLPPRLPNLTGLETAAFYAPCHETAGDYYHVFDGSDATYFVLVDVSGKGIGAAMVASSIHTFLSVGLRKSAALADVVFDLSEFLLQTFQQEKYATGVFIEARADGAIRYVIAGHPPVLVAQRRGVDALSATGVPLGLLPGMRYEEGEFQLAPGDTLLAYSDGYNEAQDPRDELLGVEALQSVLAETRESPLEDVVVALNGEVLRFQAGEPDHDDRTLLLVRRTPADR
jgi:sigma-B regulation protein RsbU (phosphoserine phosphatase)